MSFLSKLLAISFALVTVSVAQAACTTPTGVDGELKFISPQLKYCSNTTWVTVDDTNTAVSCSVAGQIIYQSSEIQYCNGTTWRKTATATTYGSCAVANAGQFYYGTPANNYYWFCNGSAWRRVP